MCANGLVGGENISDAQLQNALLDLPDQLVEQGRVGREGGRCDFVQGDVTLGRSVPSENDGHRAAVGDCGQCQVIEPCTIGQAGNPLRDDRANTFGEGIASLKDVVSPEGTYERLVGA